MEKEKIIPKFMRAKQLALHLGIGLSTVWLYAKQGKITPKKASDRVTLFEVVEVEKALLGGLIWECFILATYNKDMTL